MPFFLRRVTQLGRDRLNGPLMLTKTRVSQETGRLRFAVRGGTSAPFFFDVAVIPAVPDFAR